MTSNATNGPPILPGCSVLPPIKPTTNGKARSTTGEGKNKAKGKATGARFKTINTFADFTLARLGRAELAVWLLLWRDTKPDGLARTSQADLARRAGVNERTVKRAVAALADAGLVTIVHRGGLRRGASSYRVHSLAQGGMGVTL